MMQLHNDIDNVYDNNISYIHTYINIASYLPIAISSTCLNNAFPSARPATAVSLSALSLSSSPRCKHSSLRCWSDTAPRYAARLVVGGRILGAAVGVGVVVLVVGVAEVGVVEVVVGVLVVLVVVVVVAAAAAGLRCSRQVTSICPSASQYSLHQCMHIHRLAYREVYIAYMSVSLP
jgi:hypothetical protein